MGNIIKILLFLNTIRYLRIKQIFFRAFRGLRKIPIIKDPKSIRVPQHEWVKFSLYDEKIDLNFNAKFLNFSKKLDLPEDWNNKSLQKLWLYNLHYFDCMLEHNNSEKNLFYEELIISWMQNNPLGKGVGWDSYPISLRIVNMLKYWLNGNQLKENIHINIYSQALYLKNNLEHDILANHIFENYKALIFSGIVYDDRKMLLIGIHGLIHEINEQILEDGMHFELSPMYHAIITVGILDLINILDSYKLPELEELKHLINSKIPLMLGSLVDMSFNNESLSFFNDSADGIAPKIDIILDYAAKLGLRPSLPKGKQKYYLSNRGGYQIIQNNSSKLIFDATNLLASYQPGHSHADALSFEFAFNQEKVFVNSGISGYQIGNLRHMQRSTRSHNTIEINNSDSSEVWSNHRVGKRAVVVSSDPIILDNSKVICKARHNGYSKSLKTLLHERQIELENNNLHIIDSISGTYNSAISRIYIHPDISALPENGKVILLGKSFKGIITTNNMPIKITESKYYPEFGLQKNNNCIEIELTSRKLITSVQFKLI